jgi:cytochrome bd-type quinol oxidase subunit 1
MVALLGRGVQLAGMGVTLNPDPSEEVLTVSANCIALHAFLAGALAACLVILAVFLIYRLASNPRKGLRIHWNR